jgi:hypothetical protein
MKGEFVRRYGVYKDSHIFRYRRLSLGQLLQQTREKICGLLFLLPSKVAIPGTLEIAMPSTSELRSRHGESLPHPKGREKFRTNQTSPCPRTAMATSLKAALLGGYVHLTYGVAFYISRLRANICLYDWNMSNSATHIPQEKN